jgi:hypothetical protein
MSLPANITVVFLSGFKPLKTAVGGKNFNSIAKGLRSFRPSWAESLWQSFW